MPRGNWTHDETLMALGFYLSSPPGGRKNWDKTDDAVLRLANMIGRTPAAVCFKIGNLKANDPNRPGVGFTNGSRLDQECIQEYLEDPDGTLVNCSKVLAHAGFSFSAEGSLVYDSESQMTPGINPDPKELILGSERIVETRERVNQGYFRNVLLDNYQGRCCMSGLAVPQLLVASHIKPWAKATPFEKTSVRNGLLLNALCDRAFDRGLITVLPDYTVRVSNRLPRTPANEKWLYAFDGAKIMLPDDPNHVTWPDVAMLEYHNDCIFEATG